MTDCHDKEIRRKNMAAVKGKNTKPEMQIRSLLHRNGFRFRLHDKDIAGKPDIILKKHKAVIFVHGCFWHYHGCYKSSIPQDNKEFWEEKLNKNKKRDEKNIEELINSGWRVLVIWECALKGKFKKPDHDLKAEILEWLFSDNNCLNIQG